MNDYASRGWTALGDPTRFAIFESLVERPQAVTELAAQFPVSRPAVSQHLKVLKHAGLVADRPSGKHRIYHVEPAALVALRDQLDQYWNRVLAGYKQIIENTED